MPRTPRTHYRPPGRHVAACNLPSWLPDAEATSDPGLVTCGMCHRTRLYRDAVSALPGLAVLNPELIIKGIM